jgi:hypothetical protein
VTSDKVGHGYLPVYQDLADHELPLMPRVVEIGIANGEGLRLYREIFPAAWIAGVDIHVTQQARTAVLDPHQLVQASQDDPRLPRMLRDATGIDDWDLVVDDASHDPGLTLATLHNMWPTVARRGWYVIEDWSHANMILRALAVGLVDEFQENPAARPLGLAHLDSITYRPGLIMLRKQAAP